MLIPAWAVSGPYEGFSIHGPPHVHQLAADPDRHLIQVSSSMWSWASCPQPAGDGRPEGEHPTPDALVGDLNPLLGGEFFEVAEREAQGHPHRMLDDVA